MSGRLSLGWLIVWYFELLQSSLEVLKYRYKWRVSCMLVTQLKKLFCRLSVISDEDSDSSVLEYLLSSPPRPKSLAVSSALAGVRRPVRRWQVAGGCQSGQESGGQVVPGRGRQLRAVGRGRRPRRAPAKTAGRAARRVRLLQEGAGRERQDADGADPEAGGPADGAQVGTGR